MFPMQGNQSDETLYVDDVFSTYTYTGNGSTQTITNGIDLAGKGGLVWLKARSAASHHNLLDTARGANKTLYTSSTVGQSTDTDTINSYNSNGFTLGVGTSTGGSNTNLSTYVSWTFRKAAKFFDVVTYSGNNGNQTISHSLGQTPGMIVVKRTDAASAVGWYVWHRSLTSGNLLVLNSTAAEIVGDGCIHTVTSTSFSLTATADTNGTGTYVAYLFAHDTAADGIIQCGSFTANGGGSDLTINLGWEPQYVMMKNVSVSNDWHVFDTSRGFGVDRPINLLRANTSGAEQVETGSSYFGIYANGFKTLVSSGGFSYAAGNTVIYLAIRRPNKPPTLGTQVYDGTVSSAATGTPLTTGFPVDMQFLFDRSVGGVGRTTVVDRLRGASSTSSPLALNLITSSSVAEANTYNATRNWNNTGFEMPNSFGGESMVFHSFRRAPGVFDVVVANNNGTTGVFTSSHNLGVTPTLSIARPRTASQNWMVAADTGSGYRLLNLNQNYSDQGAASFTASATSFTWSAYAMGFGNDSSIAYLFATKAGISKVGSYTGNGSSQTINCGFSAGARFILIKRTDSTGDWYVWDSTRGIVAGNDPHLSLNTTAAEVTTDDSIDPANEGFSVNQLAATNINVTSATYIFLALS